MIIVEPYGHLLTVQSIVPNSLQVRMCYCLTTVNLEDFVSRYMSDFIVHSIPLDKDTYEYLGDNFDFPSYPFYKTGT